MKAPKKDSKVLVEVYNYKTKSSEWLPGTVIKVISATDKKYRVEVQMDNGTIYDGNNAAAPECVKPIQKESVA